MKRKNNKNYFRKFAEITNISLTAELFINLILVVFVSIAASVIIAFRVGHSSLEQQVVGGMEIAVENKEGQLLEFINHQRNRALDFSTDGLILTNTRRIIAGETGTAVEALNDHLENNKLALNTTITGINIVEPGGAIIASSSPDKVGEQEFFGEDEAAIKDLEFKSAHVTDIGSTHHFSENGRVIRVFAPMVDTNGNVIAYVVNYITPEKIDDMMLGRRKEELGANEDDRDVAIGTFNIYLVNKDGVIITQSRRKDYVPFEKTINTEPYANCRNGEETIGQYTSYNDQMVVGSSVCTIHAWTLVAEIDSEEAFSGVQEFQENLFLLGVALFAIAVVIAFGLVRKNVYPINELTKTVESFGRGNFSNRAKVKTRNEVGHLAEEFNKMADKIEELDESKNEFISFVSHQLKNPLSVISLNTELLREEDNSEEEIKEYAETISRSITNVTRLIDALLNVSRIERGVFDFKKESVDIKKLASRVVDSLDTNVKAKNLNIEKEYDQKSCVIETDRNMLQIILENLVSNAVKYTPEEGTITISVTGKRKNILISVKDTGPGIREEDKRKVFKKFFRGNGTNIAGTEGSGLGLYMTYKLVSKLGGKIRFESKEGEGAQFFVTLPIK